MFIPPPVSTFTIAQVAKLTLAAYEREYWAGHCNPSRVAAALLKTAADQFFPTLGPPILPTLPADLEQHQLLYEALTAQSQLYYICSQFHALINHLAEQQAPPFACSLDSSHDS
jgi:hypothetical protein